MNYEALLALTNLGSMNDAMRLATRQLVASTVVMRMHNKVLWFQENAL